MHNNAVDVPEESPRHFASPRGLQEQSQIMDAPLAAVPAGSEQKQENQQRGGVVSCREDGRRKCALEGISAIYPLVANALPLRDNARIRGQGREVSRRRKEIPRKSVPLHTKSRSQRSGSFG